MKKLIKDVMKVVLFKTVAVSKKVVSRSPRLKRIALTIAAKTLPLHQKDPYHHWLDKNFPDFIEISKLNKLNDALHYRPLISVVVPTYNTKPEFLRDCIESVQAQVYQNWELCIVDDASPNAEVRRIIKKYAASDDRIKFKALKSNKHIAGATNEAVAMAKGEFIGLFDHDDMLWPNALLEVVGALNKDKKLDFLYSDEDKISESRYEHFSPFFKPDWNPDFLHSVNYITHFAVVRTTLLNSLGGLQAEYNGAQDWDLFLRVTSATKRIYHIPKVLYSWRVHDLSTAKSTDAKPYVIHAQHKALKDDLTRKGYPNAIVERDEVHTGYWKVTYPIVGDPLVSIVIPTKNQHKIVKRCIDSIIEKTTYTNYEIILVDTGSTEANVRSWYKAITAQHNNIKVVDWPEQPFSYARSCNEGARNTKGDILIMLNNDTEVITPQWIELLSGDAQRSEVGAVSCLLFFPDGHHIQHAGVGVGLGGVAANSFSMMTLQHAMSQTQHLMINTRHNMTAVTAACLAIRKNVFDEIGGFDEEFRVTYNDVDLCLRLYEAGYQNLYTPHVRLLHHESISVGLPEEIAKRDTTEFNAAKDMFRTRWKKYIDNDPNLNPNLSKDNALYELPSPN
ncbi:MAG: glycosyltransferase family 2 protein [Candidatus Microsaccharimonas sp.]